MQMNINVWLRLVVSTATDSITQFFFAIIVKPVLKETSNERKIFIIFVKGIYISLS